MYATLAEISLGLPIVITCLTTNEQTLEPGIEEGLTMVGMKP